MKIIRAGLLVLLSIYSVSTFAHQGEYHLENNKTWHLMNEATPISASFSMYKDGTVVLEDDNNQHIQYPLASFSEEDQTFIFEKHTLIKRINGQAVENESSANYAYGRVSVQIFLGFGWLFLFVFIYRLAAKKEPLGGDHIECNTILCIFKLGFL